MEILITIADLALSLFTITGMLSVGLSLTGGQALRPLRNLHLSILILMASFVLTPLLALAVILLS